MECVACRGVEEGEYARLLHVSTHDKKEEFQQCVFFFV